MHELFAYLAGIGCSLCYGAATVLEQVAARRHTTIRSLHPSHFIKLFQQLPYLSGIALDLIGWGLFLFAARTLPLFLDLSFVAASLMVTALITQLQVASKMSQTEKYAIGLVMLGILLLGMLAEPSTLHPVSHHFVVGLEIFPLLLAVIGAWWLRSTSTSTRAAGLALAICAGLAFGATGIISRIIHVSHFNIHTLTQPLILSLVAYGALGMLFLVAALQKDTLNRVNSALYSSELAIPSLIGIGLLGDRPRDGLWILVIIGFMCVILGTVGIAKDSKVPH